MKITDTTIKALQDKGATRWIKGDHDRLYLNTAINSLLGLEITRYKSGNISGATLNGEKISNAEAGRITFALDSAYIDLKTGALVTKKADSYRDLLEAALKDLIESEKAQEGTPEPGTEDLDKETGTTDSVQDAQEESKEETMKVALSQDQLTQHTGTDYDASIGKMYHWLVVKVEDTEIRVMRFVDEDFEADTPEMYASWDRHWDDMYAEYLEKLAAI